MTAELGLEPKFPESEPGVLPIKRLRKSIWGSGLTRPLLIVLKANRRSGSRTRAIGL